jgi:hypothetical protein
MAFSFWFLVVGDDGPTDHGCLDELGACTDNGKDFHIF